MDDKKLILECGRVIAGLQETEALAIAGKDDTDLYNDIAEETHLTLKTVIATTAATLAGCAAKAAIYMSMAREDLAYSLAADILSIAEAVTPVLTAVT